MLQEMMGCSKPSTVTFLHLDSSWCSKFSTFGSWLVTSLLSSKRQQFGQSPSLETHLSSLIDAPLHFLDHKTKERLLKIQRVPATGVRKCQVINAMVLPLWTYVADAYYAPRTLLVHVRSLCLTVIKSAFHLMRSASTDALVSPWKQGGQNLWDVCDLYKAFTITAYFYYLNTPSSIAYQVVLSRLDHYQVKKHLSISPLSDVSSAHSLPSDTIGRVRRFMNELGVRFSLSIPPVQDPASTGIPVFRSFPKDTTVIQARGVDLFVDIPSQLHQFLASRGLGTLKL